MTGPLPSGHLREEVSGLVDGVLSDDARERALAHLTVCEACRAEVDAERRVKAAVAGLPAPAMSAGLAARLLAVPAEPPSPRGGPAGAGPVQGPAALVRTGRRRRTRHRHPAPAGAERPAARPTGGRRAPATAGSGRRWRTVAGSMSLLAAAVAATFALGGGSGGGAAVTPPQDSVSQHVASTSRVPLVDPATTVVTVVRGR